MSTVDVRRRRPASKTGTVELPAEIFDVQVNIPLIHQVVVAQLAAARQGTHDTKTRGEVRGGGRKPYRQKGTGRARQGSTRAPQFAGGGVVHGPTPRDYAQRTPKKMKAAALRGALSDRARDGRVHVVSRPRRRRRAVDQGGRRRARPASPSASTCSSCVERDDERGLEEPAQRRPRAPARRRPAQHLRRARLRRRGLHPGRARRRSSPGPATRQVGAKAVATPRPRPRRHAVSAHPQGPARRPARAGRLREELRAARREQVHVPRRTRTPTRPRSRSRSRRSSASR